MKIIGAALSIILLANFPQISVCDSISIVTCCDWNGHYRLELIPHPYNCEVFYQCEPSLMPNGQYATIPTLKNCSLDENGNRQHYDVWQCRCLRSNEATCYDQRDREQYLGFFNCTLPFTEAGLNVKCSR